MILHIPHSATRLPEAFQVCEGVSLEKELQRMTDWYTDELFNCDHTDRLVFPYSRLYCDVERFRDDAEESMASKGMGVCYTRSSYGKPLRVVSEEEKDFIKTTYYDKHHQKLTTLVDASLARSGKALIVDCHSFSNEVLPHEESCIRPDICIGTDAFHTPMELLSKIYRYFTQRGYCVAVNEPFAGTIVPLKYYGKDQRVSSVMIEVNRNLYLDEDFQKSEDFDVIRKLICELLEKLSQNDFKLKYDRTRDIGD